MRTWRLGRLVLRLLQARFPQLPWVPTADLLCVVEELLTTAASLDEAMVLVEPAPSGVTHTRLVLRPIRRDEAP